MTYYPNGTELSLLFSNNTYQSLDDIKTVVDTILDVEGYTFDVLCSYPINGQYGVLPRTLYYGLLVFSLLFRSHMWIAAACLGVAFTYSGTAAIHAFALATRFKFSHYGGGVHKDHVVASDLGDLDMNVIWVILSTGGLMLTPILNWSDTLRDKARVITVYWGFLLFAGLICALWAIWSGHDPYMELGLATCFEDAGPGCDMTAAKNDFEHFNPPREFWRGCQCVDTCDQVLSDAPFRSHTSMVPYVKPTKAMKIIATEPFGRVKRLNEFFVIFVAIQGILGLLQASHTQQTMRNWIFDVINRTATTANQRQSSMHRMRQRLAKWVAATFYLVSVLFAICCPAFFVSNIVVQEILLIQYPVSEPIWSVGQWSAYSALGLAVMAALIDKFNAPMWNVIALFMNRLTSRTKLVPTTPSSKYSSFDEVLWKSWVHFQAPFRFVARQTRWKVLHLSWEVHDFRVWYRDPVNYPACECDCRCDCAMCMKSVEARSLCPTNSSDPVKREGVFEVPKSHRHIKSMSSNKLPSNTEKCVTVVKTIALSPDDAEPVILGIEASRERKQRGSATF